MNYPTTLIMFPDWPGTYYDLLVSAREVLTSLVGEQNVDWAWFPGEGLSVRGFYVKCDDETLMYLNLRFLL